ncbi:Gamma-butyrobetaine dioxygenase [Colletotrichum tropicale]|nr:Gamma-butyrobetaine dioxygenase [Colletotrichum tropicale]
MRTSISSAARASRALNATRPASALSFSSRSRSHIYAPAARIHTTSPRPQGAEGAVASLRQVFGRQKPETPASEASESPKTTTSSESDLLEPYEPLTTSSTLADLDRSVRTYLRNANTLTTAIRRERSRLAQRWTYELISDDLMQIQRPFDYDNKPRPLSAIYLRDRCPCPQCVSPSSGNKSFSSAEIPEALKFDTVTQHPDGSLHITWQHDIPRAAAANHVSVFPAAGPQSMSRIATEQSIPFAPTRVYFTKDPVKRLLWDNAILAPRLRTIPYADWMAGGDAFRAGAQELAATGLVFLTGVPHSETAVADIGLTFGALKETFYGRTWDVISKPDAENVAYTSSYLGLHSDMLYLESPPRIQLLHCLENSCSGGESIFSDAFFAAREMRKRQATQLKALGEVKVPYHYSKNGFFYRQERPVFKWADDEKHVQDVWWSPPFQAPFHIPKNNKERARFREWHSGARMFQKILEDEAHMFQRKLQPGECVLFDNQRVLHGRREFDAGSGRRWLKGTYVANEDFLSTLNKLHEFRYAESRK